MKLNILQKQPTWKSETNNIEADELKNFKTVCKYKIKIQAYI